MIARRAFLSLACLDSAVAGIVSEPAEFATALQVDDQCGTDVDSPQCSLELMQLRASKLPGTRVPSVPGSSMGMPKESLAQRFEQDLRQDMAKAFAMDGQEENGQVATVVAELALRAQHAVASSHELGREVDELESDLREINDKQDELDVLEKSGVAESHAKKDDFAADLAKQAAVKFASQEVSTDTNEKHKTKAKHAASIDRKEKNMTARKDMLEEDEIRRKDEDEEEIKRRHTEHADDKLWNQDHRLCDPSTSLDLSAATIVHSNLGGHGPDSGAETLVYEGITSTEGQQVDMVVSALSSYTPHDSTKNGIHEGTFGMINMEVNTAADLLFRFISHATGSPVIMHPFYFSFFDLDQGMAHESREQITIKGFSSYSVAEDTELTVDTASDDEATFVSTYRGGKVDNPTFPKSLSELQRSRSVAAKFNEVSEFSVTFGEINYAAPQGRNFIFSGPSSLVCPRESKCSVYECPSGYHVRTMAEFLVCVGSPCTEDDRDTCCYEEPDSNDGEDEQPDTNDEHEESTAVDNNVANEEESDVDDNDADDENESDDDNIDADDEEERDTDHNDADDEEDSDAALDA